MSSTASLSVADRDLLSRANEDNIEYVRFEMCDTQCRSLGKLIPVYNLESCLKNGVNFPLPVFCVTADFNIYYSEPFFPFPNCPFYVYHDTYCVLPFITEAKVARIMVYPLLKIQNKSVFINPRTICLRQLKRLKTDFGLDLYSAFEHEFQMFEAASFDSLVLKPVWTHKRMFDNVSLSEHESYLFECERCLRAMGIPVEAMHLEYAPGQYEMPMKPKWNIQGADASFTFKTTLKQLAQKRNWIASFCTSPLMNDSEVHFCSTGAHYNHSLWRSTDDDSSAATNTAKKKTNAFFDVDSADGLSLLAKYWIGGILHHMPSLTAFANQTENCYRRTNNKVFAPGNNSWGFENRMCMIRVKTGGESGTYMEYRLSAAACNPYLVIASIVTAGMHGLRDKILPSPPCAGDPNSDELASIYEPVPESLELALDALAKDKLMCEAFGDFFIDAYVGTKQVEIADLKQFTQEFNGNRAKAETKMFAKL